MAEFLQKTLSHLKTDLCVTADKIELAGSYFISAFKYVFGILITSSQPPPRRSLRHRLENVTKRNLLFFFLFPFFSRCLSFNPPLPFSRSPFYFDHVQRVRRWGVKSRKTKPAWRASEAWARGQTEIRTVSFVKSS